jgi:hypothetical protein
VYDLYANSSDDRSRFLLGRAGTRPILVVGLNPSTATREKPDTTISKVEAVALRAGHDGFMMLNLYPVRATDPTTLPRRADRKRMQHNIDLIESIVAAQCSPVIWAAWGASIRARPFFISAATELVMRLRRYAPRWQCYGPLTAGGHPRHPSRLRYAWQFAAFEADAYAGQISGD